MRFLKLFTSLLKVLRVFIIGSFAVVIISFVVEVFFKPTGINWNADSVFRVYEPYFPELFWVIATCIDMLITLVLSLRACDAMISVMLCFKHGEYFTEMNADNFKKAGLNYLIAFLAVPLIFEIIHMVEYFASYANRLKIYGTDNLTDILRISLLGLFLYVMGEVIQKAVSIRKVNDLTI